MRSGILSSTVRLGQALVLLLLTFVVASLVVQISNLALMMSIEFGPDPGRISYVPRDLLTGAALLLVSGIVVLLIRRSFLRVKSGGPPDASVTPPFPASSEQEVGSFLRRFVPGLAHLRIRMTSLASSFVTPDTLFLNVRHLAPLARMASRAAGTHHGPEQAKPPSQERAAFVTLAHEEFHQLCFDARHDATLRALCFVQIMALTPVFILLLAASLPGELLWAVIVLMPVWFPFLMWVLRWGLNGGSHLLEHLADAHATQRLTSPRAHPQAAPQPDIPFTGISPPVYLDSRGHHPPPVTRLRFIRTLEVGYIARLIFFQTLILFTLAADQGANEAVESHLGAAPLAGVRLCALIVVALSSLAFSALAGALAPVRHVAGATVLVPLLLLAQVLWTAHLALARDSAWLLLVLIPAIGQLGGQLFLRRQLTGMLRTGTAPEDLPPRVEHWDSAEESLWTALIPRSSPDDQPRSSPPENPPRFFQRLLGLAQTHGRFFDAVLATALSFFIALSLAIIVPRPGMGVSGAFLVALCVFLLAIYFTPWPERRSGILVLWGARVMVLLLALLLGALFINFHLYVLEQGSKISPQDPAQRQLCIGQILINPERLMKILEEVIAWTFDRCEKAQIIPPHLLQGSPSFAVRWFIILRCAFHTPGHAIGPVFLACILISSCFDTALSTLRWLGAGRPTPKEPE